MAEYIERESAIQAIEKTLWQYQQSVIELRKVPSTDVAPVRHGRWIEPPRLYYGAKQYECSICYSDTFWNKHCITEKYKHCPNCGCKMDLGD